MNRKNNSAKNEKSTEKTAIYVALIGLTGTVIVALIGILNTRAQILLPVSLTQTAQVVSITNATNTSSPTLSSQPISTGLPITSESTSSDWVIFERWLKFSDKDSWGETVELWAIQSDGSGLRQLTKGYYDNEVSWSPDGIHFAFRRSKYGILILDLSGNTQYLGTGQVYPQWIDSQNIIYNDRINDKWVLRQSTIDGQDKGVLNVQINEPFAPKISPDRKLIATGGKDGLNIITISNNSVTKLLDWESTYPSAWKPDNKNLIFVDKSGNCWELDIRTLQQQPFPDVDECNISYSSDETQAVYQYNNGIWIMNSDGTNKRPLTMPSDNSHYRAPVWQP